MAGKKPAKPIAGQSRAKVEDPAIYGTLAMFIGAKNAQCVCSVCERKIVRGMIRLLGDSRYCSKKCILSITTKTQESTPA